MVPRRSLEKRVALVLVIYALVLSLGSSGYHFLQNWSWFDSLYMTVITITTVGFLEVHPLDQTGRAFTMVLSVLGVGVFFYSISIMAEYILTTRIGDLFARRRRRRVAKMKDHYIVCGYGRVGLQVVEELRREKRPYVVIEENEKILHAVIERGDSVVIGNANNDEILQQAGIGNAAGLLATLGNDAANLMLVLSARALNRKLFIAARANDPATESKLTTAGANRVISPYTIAGRRIAQMVVRPHVVDFLDLVMHDESLELLMEDVVVGSGCSLDGCTIGDARVREKTGINILGARRAEDGRFMSAPTPETVLRANDVVVALGTHDQLNRFRTLGR